jgi:hypothetical protein
MTRTAAGRCMSVRPDTASRVHDTVRDQNQKAWNSPLGHIRLLQHA